MGLKCSLEVVAGVVPGSPIPEFTRRWHFTAEDIENKNKLIDDSGAAMNYAMCLQNPKTVNWVRLDWIWY